MREAVNLLRWVLPGIVALIASSAARAVPTLTGQPPLVINHRGASGYLPEETLEAYQLSVAQHADFLEGDVYLTADNVPIMLHDGTLDATTNVQQYAATHPAIAALRSPDGTFDATRFTFAQIEELTAGFRNAPGYGTDRQFYDPAHDYKIITLNQLADLAYNDHLSTGQAIGIYPEAKQSGLPVANAILAVLQDPKYNGYFDAGRNTAILQSFDPSQVAYLNDRTALPVTLLGVCPTTAAQATQIATFAQGVGPSYTDTTPECVQLAHDAGLYVHPYTFLNDPAQYRIYYGYGVDGVFSNFADIALSVRDGVSVPEPTSATVLCLGIAGAAGLRRKKPRR